MPNIFLHELIQLRCCFVMMEQHLGDYNETMLLTSSVVGLVVGVICR